MFNSNKSIDRLTNPKSRSKECSSHCKVCQAPAMYSNFGVICCSPCKMFFKRNAELKREHFKCSFDDQCEVNWSNRRGCTSCRLRQCFAIGMKIELLRGSRMKKNKKREKQIRVDQQHLPVHNILQCDQMTLTIEQWNMLSRVRDSIDADEQFSLVKQYLVEQNSLPPKLRFKCRSMHHLLSLLSSKTEFFFVKNADFLSLCPHDRSILCHRLMKYIVFIDLSFIVQQTRLIEYPALQTLFGPMRVSTLLDDAGGLLMKLFLTMICFSTFDYVTYVDNSTDHLREINRILEIQNMYVDLAWRYLICHYDERQAVMYFSSLVKYLFTVNETISLIQSEKSFVEMIHSTIERAEAMSRVWN